MGDGDCGRVLQGLTRALLGSRLKGVACCQVSAPLQPLVPHCSCLRGKQNDLAVVIFKGALFRDWLSWRSRLALPGLGHLWPMCLTTCFHLQLLVPLFFFSLMDLLSSHLTPNVSDLPAELSSFPMGLALHPGPSDLGMDLWASPA